MKLRDIVLACCIGTAGCSAINKQISIDPKLYVNTSSEHYVLQKDRKSGEKDLVALCSSATEEEAWVYIEDNTSKWYEDGTFESEANVVYESSIKRWTKMEGVKAISFYHIHPEYKNAFVEVSQLPTVLQDIITFHTIIQAYNLKAPEIVDKVDFRIAVSTGVYTFKFKKSLLASPKARNEFVQKMIDMQDELAKINVGVSEEFNYRNDNKKNFAKLNKKLATLYSTPYMKITFEEVK